MSRSLLMSKCLASIAALIFFIFFYFTGSFEPPRRFFTHCCAARKPQVHEFYIRHVGRGAIATSGILVRTLGGGGDRTLDLWIANNDLIHSAIPPLIHSAIPASCFRNCYRWASLPNVSSSGCFCFMSALFGSSSLKLRCSVMISNRRLNNR